MRRSSSMILGLALVLAPASTVAAQTAAASAADHRITGFRHARFGMTPDQVRGAIAADFPGHTAIVSKRDMAEGTDIFQLEAQALEPGPGPATISYIFGATSHQLSHINIVWRTNAQPTPAERASMAVAGVQLADYFRRQGFPARNQADATRLGKDGAMLLFLASDRSGALVELVADGLRIGAPAGTSVPTGPAILRLSYARNPANPDVRSPGGWAGGAGKN